MSPGDGQAGETGSFWLVEGHRSGKEMTFGFLRDERSERRALRSRSRPSRIWTGDPDEWKQQAVHRSRWMLSFPG